MNLYVAGSSSSGNCYLLYDDKGILIIEAGVPFKQLNKLHFFDMRKVIGCIITHEHGDHAGRVKEFQDHGIKCYASTGTIEKLNKDVKNICFFDSKVFNVEHFPVDHDASDPIGFYISYKGGNVLFATDTYCLRYTFPKLTSVIIECNYASDILNKNFESGSISKSRRDRTILSHMELGVCIDTIISNDLSDVNKIVLIHLSDSNSNEEIFLKSVKEATNKVTHAGREGLNIDLDLPF